MSRFLLSVDDHSRRLRVATEAEDQTIFNVGAEPHTLGGCENLVLGE